MRRTSFLIALLISLALCSTLVASATDIKPLLSDTKDGLEAELTVTTHESGQSVGLLLSVTNQNAQNVSNLSANLVLSGGLVLEQGSESAPLVLNPGESTQLSYTLALPQPEQQTTPPKASIPEGEGEQSGCGSALACGALVAVLAAGGAVLVKKNKKAGVALMLLAVMAVTSVGAVLPASAADTQRNITLLDVVTLDNTEYIIEVRIDYTHSFTETKAEGTDGMEKFEITYYWGPHGENMYNEEFIKAIAECGFTSIPLENNSVEANKAALALLKKYGLTCSALWDYRINDVAGHDRNVSPDTSQEEVDKVVQAVVADYAGFDNIEGWWVQDEPTAKRFEILGKIVSAFKRFDPERTTMINLFPTYASSSQLGTSTYKQYLDRFLAEVKPAYISYDHYHFLRNQNPRQGFFTNLELVREASLQSGLDAMQIILLTEHMSYDDLTHSQIMWEVNMSLAYGMKRVSYFTFILDQDLLDQGWDNACMDYKGNKYPHYYDVQKINKWLLPLGRELFDKTSTAVFHVSRSVEKECEKYTSYGDLGEINGNNFLVGFFDDNSFMIVNKAYAEIEASTKQLEFLDIERGLQYFDTESAQWRDAEAAGVAVRNETGKLAVTFGPGEGMLFRVQN